MSDNEHERFVDVKPQVIEGEDQFPREPVPPLDPYTPEPGPGPGEERAFNVMRLTWVVLLLSVVVFAIVVLFKLY